jgi:hypothetical protein
MILPDDLEFPLFVRTPKSSWKRGGALWQHRSIAAPGFVRPMRMRDAGKPISRPTLSDYQLGTAHEEVFKLVAEAARGRSARRFEDAMDGLFDTNTDESA